ncbi:MAG: ferritin-like domain-containing protein [Actinomycetota bacterium]|nr:ferritin-like domain-containing protein [Actinomycetota bacterium]
MTKLAAGVKNLGAAAYLGQAQHIQSEEVLAAALAIHSIEAHHAATLNPLLHKSPTPTGAFATPGQQGPRSSGRSSRSSPERSRHPVTCFVRGPDGLSRARSAALLTRG